jgi:glucosamine-6-phosphate deaminase
VSAKLTTLDSADAVGAYVAKHILGLIDSAADSGRRLVMGAPTGRTPRPILVALARELASRPRDLSTLTLAMLDEYLITKDGSHAWAPSEKPWACHHYVREEIVAALNKPLPAAKQIRDANVWFPDPGDPGGYDKRIADAGGVDYYLLASGASDGHVAFNQPGSPRDSWTRVVPLSDPTRRDNLKTNPSFGSIENVPTHGVTVGIASIAASRSAAMVVWGANKKVTLKQILGRKHYDPQWPATVIHEVPHGEIVADREAAAS